MLGFDWEYSSHDLTEDRLESFLGSLDECWRGFSLTMPLKEEAHRLSVARDRVAERSGVVNTLLRTDAGWNGFNTDVAGLRMALRDAAFSTQHTVVLGAGATAVSAVIAAQDEGAETVTVLARRPDAAAALAERFGCRSGALHDASAVSPVSTVISTLPGPVGEQVVLPDALFAAPLYDVAYAPWPSPLSKRWIAAGSRAESGLSMLINQALIQIRIFASGDPDRELPDEAGVIAAMRSASVEE